MGENKDYAPPGMRDRRLYRTAWQPRALWLARTRTLRREEKADPSWSGRQRFHRENPRTDVGKPAASSDRPESIPRKGRKRPPRALGKAGARCGDQIHRMDP